MLPHNHKKGTSWDGERPDSNPRCDGSTKSVQPSLEATSEVGTSPGLLQIEPTQKGERSTRPRGSYGGRSECMSNMAGRRRSRNRTSLSSSSSENEGVTRDLDKEGGSSANRRGVLAVAHVMSDKNPKQKSSTRIHSAGQVSTLYPRDRPGRGQASTDGGMIQGKAVELEVAGWLAELKHNEGQMKTVLSECGRPGSFGEITRVCHKLQTAGLRLILSDLEGASRQDVGMRLWRSAHYSVIETMRKRMQNSTDKANGVRQILETFLDNSLTFYTSLLQEIQNCYQFDLSWLLSGKSQFQSKTHHRFVIMASLICQGCYMNLGDLTRYQEQLADKPDWTRPRTYYLKAQQLAPKDGKPYSRLAVIAINAHRRLDAVYFYVRSLSAKSPFQSAHESLVGLFEETCKKAKRQEEVERKAREKADREAARRRQKAEKRNKKVVRKKQVSEELGGGQLFTSGRKEVWILPGCEVGRTRELNERDQQAGTASQVGVATSQQAPMDRLTQLSSSELSKKLVSTFLVVHGKLFTKIGIETVDPAIEAFYVVWVSMLRREEAPLSAASMVIKMMVINIFSVHHALTANRDDIIGLKYYCSLGFRVAAKFTAALLRRCTDLLAGVDSYNRPSRGELEGVSGRGGTGLAGAGLHQTRDRIESSSSTAESAASCDKEKPRLSVCGAGYCKASSLHPSLLPILDTLSTLLPAIKMWFDWLVHQKSLWQQFVSAVSTGTLVEFWGTAVEFMNKCLSVFQDNSDPASGPSVGYHSLWEDRLLAGFMPLKASLSTEDSFTIRDAAQLSTEHLRDQCLERMALLARHLRVLSSESHFGVSYDPDSQLFSVREPVSELVSSTAVLETATAMDVRRPPGEVSGSEDTQEDSDDAIIVEEDSSPESDPTIETTNIDSEPPHDATTYRIEQLKAQKEMLTRKIGEQDIAMDTAQALLDEAAMKASWEVHITPKYLVPDTNCFVDMLPSLRSLVESGLFTLAIPLTVLTELEGLRKGKDKEDPQTGFTGSTGSGAKAALAYITGEFAQQSPHLRALTTQGSLLQTLSFRAEVTGKVSNDDLILESCLNLHNKVDWARHGEGVELHSVVLLTDDRNLRVKAHASSLPVRELPAFMKIVRTTRHT